MASTEVKAKTAVSTKLKRLSNERLIKTVYQWSCQNRRGWEPKVTQMANKLNITTIISNDSMSVKNIVRSVHNKLCANDKILWENELVKSDELRTCTIQN